MLGIKLGLQKEQQVLLSTEPSLWLPFVIFIHNFDPFHCHFSISGPLSLLKPFYLIINVRRARGRRCRGTHIQGGLRQSQCVCCTKQLPCLHPVDEIVHGQGWGEPVTLKSDHRGEESRGQEQGFGLGSVCFLFLTGTALPSTRGFNLSITSSSAQRQRLHKDAALSPQFSVTRGSPKVHVREL